MATGPVSAPTVPATRTAEDFAAPLATAVATDPEAGWMFVADSRTLHCAASFVRYVAPGGGVAEGLGKRGKRGVLKSVATRQAFRTDPRHRIGFVYVPQHPSWRNQIASGFSLRVRRVSQRGNFRPVADLREKVRAFIASDNRTWAQPFQWTLTGRPLDV